MILTIALTLSYKTPGFLYLIIEDHRQRFGYAFYFVNIKYLYFCFVFAFIEQDQTTFLLRPGRGAEYCDQPFCQCAHLLWAWRCGTSCTSGSMDDGRIGGATGKGWWHSATVINYVRDRDGV